MVEIELLVSEKEDNLPKFFKDPEISV